MRTAKRTGIFCAFMLFTNLIFAQSQISEPAQDAKAPFRLFRTTNIWTFIQLDTTTGQMWQIQFDTKGIERGAMVLNLENLAEGKQKVTGRFTLYPTSNMYTFILLDQIDEPTWQVQWAVDVKNRLVLPISE